MISVLPSYYEGLSMTVLEAMAKGIPLVTTNISTMPEVVSRPEMLVDPGNVTALANTMLKLSDDRDLRMELSHEEFEMIKTKFSLETMISRSLSIYREIL